MCSLCRLPVAKTHNFFANYDILGAPVPTPFFGVLEQTQGLHLQAKFHLNAFTVSASDGQNTILGKF